MRRFLVAGVCWAVALATLAVAAHADQTISLDAETEWGAAIGPYITPLTPTEWSSLDADFQANVIGTGLNPVEFVESTVWASGGGMYSHPEGTELFELPPGMGMEWAIDAAPTVDTNYIAGWKYTYGEDPNLQGQTMWLDVNPPNVSPATGFGIATVGIGLVDVNGLTRSWTYNCAAGGPGVPGPGVFQYNIINEVLLSVAPIGLGAAGDALHHVMPPPWPGTWPLPWPPPWSGAAYADNGFDPTLCVSIVGIENGFVPVGGSIVAPPPGGAGRSIFNWWGVMMVTPEPVSLSLMGVGLIGIALRKRLKRTA